MIINLIDIFEFASGTMLVAMAPGLRCSHTMAVGELLQVMANLLDIKQLLVYRLGTVDQGAAQSKRKRLPGYNVGTADQGAGQ